MKAKHLLQELFAAQYNFDIAVVGELITKLFAKDAVVNLCYPFETIDCDTLINQPLQQLYSAAPDLERRNTIVIEGTDSNGEVWVGCCGYFTGSFVQPFLDIQPTGRQFSLRFHEFYKVTDNKVTELQAIWDLPELMLQANCWPLAPSLGREWHIPSPSTQDGIAATATNVELSENALSTVESMLTHLGKFANGGVAAMQLHKFWHPRCSWYGPSGIGTARGIGGFRNCHQIPFLNAMPDRVGDPNTGHLFAENNYVAFTAWPGMKMTVSNDGWLGIAASNQKITMRSLDFWRVEDKLIRENWVLIDLLDVYKQLNVDVFARLKEFNKIRKL